ncbi:MAG: gluconate 2-dehydrogenase subunit 3 family protein [Deltaproteobacteria bacterium]|nr:gluconate 2-dehydrogenase subunit 3 family protein [Deltaproteobacteria bacterium]
MKCSRRQVLIGFFGLATGGSVALKLALGRGKGDGAKLWPKLPLDPAQTRALLAALEHVLPGALEAGVPDHIAYWLTTDKYFKNFVKDFEEGSRQLDRVAQDLHQKSFADCAGEQKDAVFKRFQSGGVRTATLDGARFFERLVTFALEGFLGDPKYGGNRNQVGWKFIGFKPCWWAPRVDTASHGGNGHTPSDHAGHH